MKINFCTYFDINYLSKFLTLKNSLNKFNIDYTFYILALDNLVIEFFKKNKFNNLKIIELDKIENKYELLKDVKKNRATIEYYFTLSPFLPKYIFEKEGINQITYLDSDFFFFKNPKKIISENIDSSVSLIKQNSKEKYGKFNVGWINFNFEYDETINIVNEWSNQCLNECSDIPKKNSYADQKYLDTWITKLKYSRVFQPEYTCLSPWDANIKLVNNTKKMISYHFHGLEMFENYFVSGFYRYNKKTNKKIIEEIYYPYIENLTSIEKRYNLKSSSIRQHRDKMLSKFFIAIRTLKSNIKKIFYNDYHSYKA